jgi:hypothetical protein
MIAPWLIWVYLGAAFRQSSEPETDWPVLALFTLLVSPLGFWGVFVTVRAIGAVLRVGFVRAIFCLFLVGSVIGYAMVQLSALPTIKPASRSSAPQTYKPAMPATPPMPNSAVG